ncbi:MAG TPA: hypothetical protein VM891_08050 [Amaricoccus sp.]|jgi:hypothetical protein|nr:hypothetical protein [Amaricoccus sp.]
MSVAARHPGGAPVARLDGLPPLERRVIRCLRLWYAGPEGEPAVRWEIGRDGAGELARRFGELLDLTAGSARRPLLGHALDCPCAGSDECIFARFVALAAEGSREEAMLMAALIVRVDVAMCLTAIAEEVGLGLMRGRPPPIAH